jgi:hypothetical protein
VNARTSNVTVAEIEQALCQVAEIKAARVVTSPEGVIQEIHVLALPSKQPKQLVRDIESTLMASFGIPVDHKKISIAQLGQDVMPKNEQPQHITSRPRIISINSQVTGVNASVTVDLELGGEAYAGKADGAASTTQRLRLVAEATMKAVEQYVEGTYSFALEDVSLVQLGRERSAVCCVAVVSPLGEETFVGSALVRQNEKDSIVKATLDAINRRMGFLTTS